MRRLPASGPRPVSQALRPRHGAAAGRCLLGLAVLVAGCSDPVPVMQVPAGEPERGRAAIERFGCAACHIIPGIASHGAQVGPPLLKLRERGYLAGVLPNTPQNMVRWLRAPTQVAPLTAMPDLGVSEAEASDIAAYLYERN